MEKLSKNLSLSEVTKSNTATRNGIDNSPTDEHLENLKAIAENIFQPMRDELGAITVSSGYRSNELNKRIGGAYKTIGGKYVATSQHCKGEALDLDNDHKTGRATNREIFDNIKDNLEFDQLISEFGTRENPSWVHVSFKKDGGNRGVVLRAERNSSGKTYYSNY